MRVTLDQHENGSFIVAVTHEVKDKSPIVIATASGKTREAAAGWALHHFRIAVARVEALLIGGMGADELVSKREREPHEPGDGAR